MEHISHGNNDDETNKTICKYIEDKLNHLIMKNKKVITVLQDTNSHVITYHKASIMLLQHIVTQVSQDSMATKGSLLP